MQYITGIHALNLKCSLETCGDWHTSALRWKNIELKETNETIFKDWGVEKDCYIPEHDGKYNVANHIRALLDLLIDGKFTVAQGMREDFICNEEYTPLVLDMVWGLKDCFNWKEIDAFMKKEYRLTWLDYKGGKQDYAI